MNELLTHGDQFCNPRTIATRARQIAAMNNGDDRDYEIMRDLAHQKRQLDWIRQEGGRFSWPTAILALR